MLLVRDELVVSSVPISVDLANDQGCISIDLKDFNPKINYGFNTEDTGLVLRHIICTFKIQPCGEGEVETSWGGDNCHNTIAMSIRSSTKNQGPSRSRFRSFLGAGDVAIPNQHNILIGEFETHKPIVFQGLVCKIVRQYTPFDDLLGDMSNVILG